MYLKPIINYENFDPEDEAREMIALAVKRIDFEAPSDSNVQFSVEKKGESYKGEMKICSSGGTFLCVSESSSIKSLITRVEETMRDKLDDWKRNRFIDLAEVC